MKKKRKVSFISRISSFYKLEFLVILLSLITILVFIPVFTYMYFAKDLQSKESIMNRNNTGVVLVDRNNKPFFTFYQAKRKIFIPLSDIPPMVQHAVIASEDRDFYKHPGFSIQSIIRSFFLNLQAGKTAYGGSTLTQQLVKNSLLTATRSFLRKYQEVVLAQEIERRYSKNEILEMYLNSVYFGEGAFGIENAALTYFGKHTKDLTIAEAAMLTGVLPSPSSFSPISGDSEAAKTRQKIVLQKMLEQHYITPEEEKQAEAEKLVYSERKDEINSRAAHFALYVKQQLIDKFGEERISRSGFKVKTTLDLDWQDYAEKVVADQVTKLAPNRVSNGAAVVIDPKNGEIKVMVGSKDWYNNVFGKLNMAITPRSPGSSFKPIVYAAGFEERIITPATLLRDSPTTFEGGYSPLDYDRRFRGRVTVRRALSNSLNIPAVDVMSKVGLERAMEMAQRLGITTLKDPSFYGLSLVLGTGEAPLDEMTNVYATFANYGVKYPLTSILEITDKQGNTIYQYKPQGEKVLEPEVAFLISSILSDNAARAEEFGNALTISRPAAVKTGTAEDYKDALTIGYTPSIAVGVWAGNNDNSPMDQIAGSLGPAPIWRSLMEKYLAGTPVEHFDPPPGVTQVAICKDSGLLLRTTNPAAFREYFIDGTTPTQECYVPHPTPVVTGGATPPSNITPPDTATPMAPGNGNGNDKVKKNKP